MNITPTRTPPTRVVPSSSDRGRGKRARRPPAPCLAPSEPASASQFNDLRQANAALSEALRSPESPTPHARRAGKRRAVTPPLGEPFASPPKRARARAAPAEIDGGPSEPGRAALPHTAQARPTRFRAPRASGVSLADKLTRGDEQMADFFSDTRRLDPQGEAGALGPPSATPKPAGRAAPRSQADAGHASLAPCADFRSGLGRAPRGPARRAALPLVATGAEGQSMQWLQSMQKALDEVEAELEPLRHPTTRRRFAPLPERR